MKKKKGFTLIELLIVIGIIAVLMAIAIVAINPGRQFAKANNAKRWGDVNAIANGISLRIVEHQGSWAAVGVGTCEDIISATGTQALAYDVDSDDNAILDICDCLITDYFGAMPVDPSTGSWTGCSDYDTGYDFTDLGGGRFQISATDAQDEGDGVPPISVSR